VKIRCQLPLTFLWACLNFVIGRLCDPTVRFGDRPRGQQGLPSPGMGQRPQRAQGLRPGMAPPHASAANRCGTLWRPPSPIGRALSRISTRNPFSALWPRLIRLHTALEPRRTSCGPHRGCAETGAGWRASKQAIRPVQVSSASAGIHETVVPDNRPHSYRLESSKGSISPSPWIITSLRNLLYYS
jgi:hypothetical protein